MERAQVRRLAVIGLGRLGRACVRAILERPELELAGVVRRPTRLEERRAPPFDRVEVASHISDLGPVEAALVCVPPELAFEAARDLLQHRIAVVECAALHGEDFLEHKRRLDRMALRHEAAAIVGAGWDPGALSLLRGLFAALTPHGHTETSHRPGKGLHHCAAASAVEGVGKALSAEVPGPQGGRQTYLYIEPAPGADPGQIEAALRRDPLWVGEELLVFFVESAAELEEAGRGVVLQRGGAAAGMAHQQLLFEARGSEAALAAEVMLAAVRALPTRHHRAYGLFDLPLRALWGELHAEAEEQWM